MSKNTKATILSAFEELLHKKQFSKISVKDITDACGISRMTFYYHFDDIYDMLNYTVTAKFRHAIDGEISYDNWRESYINIFKKLLPEKAILNKIIPHADLINAESSLCGIASDIVSKIIDKRAHELSLVISPDNKAFLINFYAFSMVGFLIKWVGGGMKEVPEVFINQICDMLGGTFEHTLRRAAKQS